MIRWVDLRVIPFIGIYDERDTDITDDECSDCSLDASKIIGLMQYKLGAVFATGVVIERHESEVKVMGTVAEVKAKIAAALR